MEYDTGQIAEILLQKATESLGGEEFQRRLQSGWRELTAYIKLIFGDLGRELRYYVAASGYPGAGQGEWLYDMVWLVDKPNGFMLRQTMVLESESLRGTRVADAARLDDDFLKLVQARADVRIWITACPNEDTASLHIKNCQDQACLFASSEDGDVYLFVIFIHSISQTRIELFRVSKSSE